MKKLIFFCIRYRIRFLSKLFHTFTLLIDVIRAKFNLYKRSPILFNWAITYIPYIQSNEWMNILYQDLSLKDKTYIDAILEKISYIAYHNVLDYKLLYSDNDEIDQQNYLIYVNSESEDNYFKKNDLGLMNQYYIERDIPEFKEVIAGKSVIDCGAFIGDSAIAFSNCLKNSHVYALEPDKSNYERLQKVISIHGKTDYVTALNFGVGERDEEGFISDDGIGSKLSDCGTKITIRSIDSIVKENSIIPGLIKRDIEGFEYYSILGSIHTIKKYKPILCISVYHHGRDLFEIKKLIQELNIGYRFTFTRRDCMLPFADLLLICY